MRRTLRSSRLGSCRTMSRQARCPIRRTPALPCRTPFSLLDRVSRRAGSSPRRRMPRKSRWHCTPCLGRNSRRAERSSPCRRKRASCRSSQAHRCDRHSQPAYTPHLSHKACTHPLGRPFRSRKLNRSACCPSRRRWGHRSSRSGCRRGTACSVRRTSSRRRRLGMRHRGKRPCRMRSHWVGSAACRDTRSSLRRCRPIRPGGRRSSAGK
jgi:hypothetical protein